MHLEFDVDMVDLNPISCLKLHLHRKLGEDSTQNPSAGTKFVSGHWLCNLVQSHSDENQQNCNEGPRSWSTREESFIKLRANGSARPLHKYDLRVLNSPTTRHDTLDPRCIFFL